MNDYQNERALDAPECETDGETELQSITLDDFLAIVFTPSRPEYENSYPNPSEIGGQN
jgi:hypothetical protein